MRSSRPRRPRPRRPRRDGRRDLPRLRDRLALGPAGLQVSPFCLGMVGDWRAIPAAFDRGINFFFVTTDLHWPLYERTRKGLADLLKRKGVRDDVVVAGACYAGAPDFYIGPYDELVVAVRGLGRVDVCVAGGVYGPDLLGRVQAMRRGGRGRAIAASFHDRAAALAAANHRIVDLSYLRYNPVHPAARREVFPALVAGAAPLFNFKSMLGYVPPAKLAARAAAHGISPDVWLPEAPDYYRYALSRPQISGVLLSMGEVRHLDELADALPQGGLTPEEEAHLEELAILSAKADA